MSYIFVCKVLLVKLKESKVMFNSIFTVSMTTKKWEAYMPFKQLFSKVKNSEILISLCQQFSAPV